MTLRCRICDNTSNNSTLQVKQTGKSYIDDFTYTLCSLCGSLTIKEIPDNLSKYYENYYSFQSFKTSKENFLHSKFNKLLFYFLCKINPKKFLRVTLDSLAINSLIAVSPKPSDSILDVGSGSGKFIYDLHQLGFSNAIGIDPFLTNNISYHNGAKIYKKALSETNNQFDIVTFHHTLEHLEDLGSTFRKIYHILKPHGICIIRIPNIDSYSFKKFRQHWTGIHAPYHLNLPSQRAIQALAVKNNLYISNILGEQLTEHFLSNVENELNLIDDTSKLFRNFTDGVFTNMDLKYWKEKTRSLRARPDLSEWIIYHLKKIE